MLLKELTTNKNIGYQNSNMKSLNFFYLLFPIFSFASTTLDFNNSSVQNQIIEKAVPDLQVRKKTNGELITYLPFDQIPFTGWKKSFHPNGQLLNIHQYKDGIQHGSAIEWYSTGQMKWKINVESTKVLNAYAWTPDGNPCPITRVRKGNGIGIIYNEDGSIASRMKWINGKESRL